MSVIIWRKLLYNDGVPQGIEQLFDILRRYDYIDAYIEKLHELDLYEDFVNVCGDIYYQIFDEWAEKYGLDFKKGND